VLIDEIQRDMPLVKQAIHENDYVEFTQPVDKVEGTGHSTTPGAWTLV
jgi:hypothetical protein